MILGWVRRHLAWDPSIVGAASRVGSGHHRVCCRGFSMGPWQIQRDGGISCDLGLNRPCRRSSPRNDAVDYRGWDRSFCGNRCDALHDSLGMRELNAKMPVVIAVLLTLLAGVACGMTNGLLIGVLRIPPFIVTLGTMTIFLGLAKRLAKGSTVFVDRDRIPDWLSKLSATMPPDWHGWYPNIALGVWIAIGVAILVAILLNYR